MRLIDIAEAKKLRLFGSNSRYKVLIEDVSAPQGDIPKYVAIIKPQKRNGSRRAVAARMLRELEAKIDALEKANEESEDD